MDYQKRIWSLEETVRMLEELVVGDGKHIGVGPQTEINRAEIVELKKEMRVLQNDKIKRDARAALVGSIGAGCMYGLFELFKWIAHGGL